MKLFKVRLIEKIKRTSIVESFRFIADSKINFLPGQFLQIIFDENNLQNKELNKYLSFSSSPTKDYIEVTKKLSKSEFSNRLSSLKVSDEIFIRAPFGNCVFKESYKKLAFLIGGMGITPVISIVEYILDKRLDTNVTIFYSNRTEEIAFKNELDNWMSTNSNIKILYIISDCIPTRKDCIFGQIDENIVLSNLSEISNTIFFIFGPPNMVVAMKDLCIRIGCQEENIKVESFIGY